MQSYKKSSRRKFWPACAALLLAGALLGNCSAFRRQSQGSGSPRADLRSGNYARAREGFESALKSTPNSDEDRYGLLETLLQTGAYRDAAQRADAFISGHDSAAARLQRGRAAEALGDYAEAEKQLRRAIELSGPFRLDAFRAMAELLEVLGRKTESVPLWDQILADYRGGRTRGSHALGNAAVAAWKRGYIDDAKEIFLDASDKRAGEAAPEALSDFGYLFLEKYRFSDALSTFRDALAINKAYAPALLGLALSQQSGGSGDAEVSARSALEINPNLTGALNLLAELRIEEENFDAALGEVRRSLQVNPADLDSLSLKAAITYMMGDNAASDDAQKKVLAVNPNYGTLYYTIAENLVMRRKYQEAVDFNRKAVSLDPQLWAARASLGMNLMRVGELQEGRKEIERAFEGDGYNVWAFNTLNLLDTMDKFAVLRSDHFSFRMAKEDEPVLGPYAPKLAEEAYASLTRRYGFTPRGPLQVEIFPDHGGFAVRTLGLPGLGALGVCFGKVVALDSPRARKPGEFNWGSTLWHEFAHVISLQMTNHNIPRWYSEGISVYEERKARPGWGDDLTPAFVKAYKDGRLLKVSELNAGMMRPKFPEQIGLSYYQASLVCELIEQKFGFDKIRQSLLLFGQGKSTEQVFRETLGWDTATLDREYGQYLDSRLKGVASHLAFGSSAGPHDEPAPQPHKRDRQALAELLNASPDDFFINLEMGALLRHEKKDAEAEPYLKKAQQLFPEYTAEGSPYQLLGGMYLDQKREDEALTEFQGWARHDANAVAPLMRAAEIYRGRKAWADVTAALERALYIDPYDPKLHTLLGEAATQSGNWPLAISAYQVLLGLNPADPADAHLSLAESFYGAGRKQEAKRQVMRALEIAPGYLKAQQLLLKLSGEQP
jgi:cellulose synthase operon protein C